MRNCKKVVSYQSGKIKCNCRKIVLYMGCHRRPDRSFFFRGKQFPMCARCTGVIIGQTFAIIVALIRIRINILYSVCLLLVMFIDWFIQKLKIKESTNIRRLFTGIFGGFGYVSMLVEMIYMIIGLFSL